MLFLLPNSSLVLSYLIVNEDAMIPQIEYSEHRGTSRGTRTNRPPGRYYNELTAREGLSTGHVALKGSNTVL